MNFTLRGQGRFRDLVVTRPKRCVFCGETPTHDKNCIAWRGGTSEEHIVIPYEFWSGPLWALLCEELERQSAKQERNTAGVTGARGKK